MYLVTWITDIYIHISVLRRVFHGDMSLNLYKMAIYIVLFSTHMCCLDLSCMAPMGYAYLDYMLPGVQVATGQSYV